MNELNKEISFYCDLTKNKFQMLFIYLKQFYYKKLKTLLSC